VCVGLQLLFFCTFILIMWILINSFLYLLTYLLTYVQNLKIEDGIL